MFKIAYSIGAFSLLIFTLGVFGLLYKNIIIASTIVYWIAIFFLFFKNSFIKNLTIIKLNYKDTFFVVLLALLFIQIIINFIGALGPEIAFDALWYHLTLPKIFLESHKIFHIPGNLLYYSDLPKLVEMLYIAGLSLGNEILPKLTHFSFGLLTMISMYLLARKFVNRRYALLSAVIFYSNLVVGWESITAYVDLARAFFEVMSFWAFIDWYENKTINRALILGLMIGFSVSVKLVSLSSLFIFLSLVIFVSIRSKYKYQLILKHILSVAVSCLIVILPWLVFSFLKSGYFLYPYFSNANVDAGKVFVLPGLLSIPGDLYKMFLGLNDPLSPIYLIFIPLIFINFKKYNSLIKLMTAYVFFSFLFWFLTQQPRGGRFLVPFLPAFSLIIVYTISLIKDKALIRISYVIIIFLAVLSFFYRAVANYKFVPVVLGLESKSTFLTKNLNFNFGDFYDTDGYFKSHIKNTDTVLLYGFHNLYYVDFPFIDSSFLKGKDKFNYIAVQNGEIPKSFSNWQMIYYNNLSKVKLYSKL